MENKKCTKCQSLNSAEATSCRYCHERFNQAKTFVERQKKKSLNKKLLLVGGAVLTAAVGYLWKKKSSSKAD